MFRICCLTAMLALGAVTHPPGPSQRAGAGGGQGN